MEVYNESGTIVTNVLWRIMWNQSRDKQGMSPLFYMKNCLAWVKIVLDEIGLSNRFKVSEMRGQIAVHYSSARLRWLVKPWHHYEGQHGLPDELGQSHFHIAPFLFCLSETGAVYYTSLSAFVKWVQIGEVSVKNVSEQSHLVTFPQLDPVLSTDINITIAWR